MQSGGPGSVRERKFYSSVLKRWLLYVASVALGLAVVGALLGGFVLALLYPTLPSLETVTDYQPKVPLRVVSAEGDLIGEFGEERRAVVRIADVPDLMKQAILAAEDERFYQHGGVDYLSVLRAAYTNLTSGSQQGAGTITMQVARNFFLSREKTLTRKLREVLLAWKIEASLTKDQILELYVNQIFLGQRAYGFAAASQLYFGKPLRDITVPEAAMLAGLPKAPSAFNPVTNPKRAKTRQLYVLRRMHELRFIDDATFERAQSAPLVVQRGVRDVLPVHAEFAAEMARQVVFDAYGEEAYTRGLTVWTTIRSADQEAAYAAVRRGVLDYDRRHGYRGPEDYVNLPEDKAALDEVLERVFQERADADSLLVGVVLAASPAEVEAVLASGDTVTVTGD
ncbi:MAG: transglycosylase domain-containing protein, partial [Burkholderiales bacterium]|nr:transglycosylase domain-containing protein [Burkholderiales bacterium]